MEFVLIPAGNFLMGGDISYEKPDQDETPPHQVTISKPFYLGKYEVTQAQWTAIMASNPSGATSESMSLAHPVEEVSWEDVQKFIERLNAKEGGTKYRLPTEAEWEYAARAGSRGKYSFGNDEGLLGQYAWYSKNSAEKTHPVGQLKPNAWGLYDMHGNVWEWVQDWYGENYYAHSSDTDPSGPPIGKTRVVRGGSMGFDVRICRTANRANDAPTNSFNDLGFRLVRMVD
jgi:formylglycine-generating enzyme required for sulfatase activity